MLIIETDNSTELIVDSSSDESENNNSYFNSVKNILSHIHTFTMLKYLLDIFVLSVNTS